MSVDLSKKEIVIASVVLILIITGVLFYAFNQEEKEITLNNVESKEELNEVDNTELYDIITAEENIELDIIDEDTLLDDIEETLNVIEEDYEIIVD